MTVRAAVDTILSVGLIGVRVVTGNQRSFAAYGGFLAARHRIDQRTRCEQPEDQREERCHDRGRGARPGHVGAIARVMPA